METSGDLAALSSDVVSELARTAQLTLSGLLAVVAALVGTVPFGRVAGMTRDIGRQRALGAPRHLVVAAILLHAACTALVGATVGVGAGAAVTLLVASAIPPWSFSVGIWLLVILAAIVGSVAPAIRAARLDPVRILRVP